MEARSMFKRSFLIFENEDSGYEAGQKPSGYIKIEERDGKGKLRLSVQNLKESGSRYSYELYLLKTTGTGFVMTRVDVLVPGNNGHSLQWAFDASNVAGSGLRTQEFDTAVILVKFNEGNPGKVICPLAAYKDTRTEWKAMAAEKLKKAESFSKEVIDNTPGRNNLKYESKYIPQENTPSYNIHDASIQKFYQTMGKTVGETINESANETIHETENEIANESISETENDMANNKTEAIKKTLEEEQTQNILDDNNKNIVKPENITDEETAENRNNTGTEGNVRDSLGNTSDVYRPAYNSINTHCVYMNGNMCSMHLNSEEANPCSGCRAYNNTPVQEKREACTGNVEKLKQLLEKNFERCDPFNSKRSDYKWWKVANPVNLNNMLYECGIRSPLLFNPAVMMSHYKYRHLIAGLFTDKQSGQDYMVCGVPGMNMVDKKPFNDMCRWVQLEGSKPIYGAFGYWLVYIEPKSGRLLNIR